MLTNAGYSEGNLLSVLNYQTLSEAGGNSWLNRLKFRKKLSREVRLHLAALLAVHIVTVAIRRVSRRGIFKE